MTCTSCDAALTTGALFCARCGTLAVEDLAPNVVAAPEVPVGLPAAAEASPPDVPLAAAPLASAHRAPPPGRGTGPLAAPTLRGTRPLPTPTTKTRDLGERRVVTILFTDISGFTALSERLDPEQVTEIINPFFECLTEPIYRYGGVVDKYIGDAIMALFGAPVAHEDDVDRALAAALAMQEAARQFSEELAARTGITIAIRVGINTGLVFAGSVGGLLKRDYTVIGDAVNLAQRLEAAAPVGDIWVAQDSRQLAARRFAFEELPAVTVKGRIAPVACYRLVGQLEAEVEAPVVLVGRHREVEQLAAAWADALAGQPAVVQVRGEPGTGKTALLRHFCATVQAHAPSLWATCTSYEFAVPLALARGVLRALLADAGFPSDRSGLTALVHDDHLSPQAREQAGWAGPSPDGKDSRAVPALEFLLTGSEVPELVNVAPEHRQAIVFAQLTEVLWARAMVAPLVLVLENLQWCDDGSAEWVQALFTSLRGKTARLLVVLTHRPGERIMPALGGGLGLRQLDLGTLDELQARELVARLIGPDAVDQLPPGLLDGILTRSAGNPRFLAAFATSLRDPAAPLATGALPISIIGLLSARLDALNLSSAARQALEALAVLGAQATRNRLERLLVGYPLEVALTELRQHDLLDAASEVPGGLGFANPLIPEVCYERILIKRRQELHGDAGDILAEDQVQPAIVAAHQARAERAQPAARYLLLAAEQSLSYYSNQEVLDLADRAEAWQERVPAEAQDPGFRSRLLRVRAMALAALGDLDAALVASAQLIVAAQGEAVALAYDLHADLLLRKGQHQAVVAACTTGLSLVPESDGPGVLWLRARRANAWLRTGEHARAMDEAQAVLASTFIREPKLKCFLLGVVGLANTRLGRLQEAYHSHLLSLTECELSGELYQLAHILNNLGTVCDGLGKNDEADRYFRRGLAVATQIGDRWIQSMLANNLGGLKTKLGQLHEACDHFRRALGIHAAMRDQHGEGIALCNLGEVSLLLGDPDAAENYYFQSVVVLEGMGDKAILGEVYRQLASLKIGQASYGEALELIKRSIALAEETDQPELHGTTLRMLSEVYARQDKPDEALPWAARSVEALSAITAPLELGRSYKQLGKVLAVLGHASQAQEARAEAIALFEKVGAKTELADVAS